MPWFDKPRCRVLFIAALVAALSAAAGAESAAPPSRSADATPQRPVEPTAAVALPDRALDRDELETFIDGVMAAQFAAHDLAGAAIVVVKGGQVLLSKGYGYADLEQRTPVDPLRTRFTVGSVSKLIVWTAVMQLVERGELDLDADVNRYLATFEIPATFQAPVTMRNLLTHTAGFEEVGAPFAPQVAGKYTTLGDFLADHLPARALPPPRDLAHAARPYSNWGALLAAHVVECISGQSFAQYATEHVFEPLGMSSSVFASAANPSSIPERALGHVRRNGAMLGVLEDMSPSGPAGGLLATAGDIGRFMMAHLQGGALGGARILGESTVLLMQQRSAQSSSYVDGMALGFMDARRNGRRILRHDGSTAFTQSELMLAPDSDLGVFVTYNSREGGYARRELARAFIDRYLPARKQQLTPDEREASALAQYEGAYRSQRRSYTTFEKLMGSLPLTVRALPNGALLIAGQQWVRIADDVFQNAPGERAAFYRDDGRIAGLSLKSSLASAERIVWLEDPRWHVLALLLILVSAFEAIRRAVRAQPAESVAHGRADVRMRRLIGVAGALIVATTLLLGSVVVGGVGDIMTHGQPLRLYIGAASGALIAVLTVVMLACTLVALHRRRSLRGQVWPLVHCAAAGLFVAMLYYWNLLDLQPG